MQFDFRSFWAFLKMLKIEVYFFLVFFCLNLQIVTNTQLMEDKLCLNELKYSREFCLSTDSEELLNDHRKYILLEETTSMNNIRTIIEVVPSMFLALFGGYWVDRYPRHIKFILSLPVIAEMTKMIILTINCYFFDLNAYLVLSGFPLCAFLGTGYACITGVNTYIAWTTPPRHRFVRFAVVELCLTLVNLLGSLIGGYVLTSKPWFSGQPSNYMAVYLIGFTSCSLALAWLLIMVDTIDGPIDYSNNSSVIKNKSIVSIEAPKHLANTQIEASSSTSSPSSSPKRSHHHHNQASALNSPPAKRNFFIELIDVFNMSTLKNVWHTIFKHRPNGARSMVINLVGCMMIFRAADFGEAGVDYQFSQRAYGWNPRTYSIYYACFHLPPALVTLILPYILNRRFKLSDTSVGIIACLSFFGQYFLRGTLLSSTGYLIAYTVGSLHRMCPAAYRSILCKIVDPHEMGEIFSVFTAVEAGIRFFESTIYTAVFNASIDDYPGLVFHIMGGTGFYFYIVFMWIDIKLHRIERKKREEAKNLTHTIGKNISNLAEKQINLGDDKIINKTSEQINTLPT